MEKSEPKNQSGPQDIHDMMKELQEQMKDLQKQMQGTVLFQVLREVTTLKKNFDMTC